MLEIGREPVYGEATDLVLAEAAEDLIAEAVGDGEYGDSKNGDEQETRSRWRDAAVTSS